MNKLLIPSVILAALVLLLTGLSLGALLDNANEKDLGARADAAISEIASSSATYFGLLLPVAVSETRTGTTTLLTVGDIHKSDKVAITIENTSTTTLSNLGTVFAQVLVSFDGSTWFPAVLDSTTNTGTQNGGLILNNGNASSTIRFTPTTIGVTWGRVIITDVAARYLKVNVWSTSTSTVLVRAHKLSQ